MAFSQGIIHVTWAPLRARAASDSEIVSALLFGETFELKDVSKDWCAVFHPKTNYHGYLSANQVEIFEENHLGELIGLLASPVLHLSNSFFPAFLPAAAEIRRKDLVRLPELENQIILPDSFSVLDRLTKQNLCNKAMEFVGIPYLWGGRCFAGIDCSGFIQVLFSLFGKLLPRDASKQAEVVVPLTFESCEPGDLLFFENENHKINHVALYLGQNKLIHASGSLHVAFVDAIGIKTIKDVYSHKLCLVGRIV